MHPFVLSIVFVASTVSGFGEWVNDSRTGRSLLTRFDAELATRALADMECGKMLEQAGQYKRMGTKQGMKAAEFLYGEIVRRYPKTVAAAEARKRLDEIGLMNPPFEGYELYRGPWRPYYWLPPRVNPFFWGRDEEPEWIRPRLNPEPAPSSGSVK